MYPVTATYKTKIKELERVFQARIQIQHSQGVLNLTDKDIALGSLIFNEASQAGEDFTIGGVVASDLTVNIVNKPEYANLQFVGATLTASIGLQLAEDEWELQEVEPDTWEEVQVSEEAWEWVPLGVFHIDEIGKTRNVIRVKAIDAMINLDMPYSLSKLVYPATLLQIFTNICNVCDIQQGTYAFPNSSHVVKDRPDVDSTFRDILAYVAELSGTFARTTRTGALELVWYEESGLTLTGTNRFDFVPRDDVIRISGITATVDGVTYIAGGGVETDVYAESGEDFSQGELDGVVAEEEGLGLENDPCLYFNGTSAQVKIDNHADLQVTNNFKFRFKVKINDINQTDKYLIAKANQPGIIFGYVSKTIEFYAASYTGTNPRSGSGIVINDTGWHEVIYEYDGINWAGYLDGNEIFKVKRTFSLRTNTANLYLGSSFSANFLDGYLDDIEIWKNGVLQGHWKFDEGSGTMAYDSSGGGHHGEIINAEWVQNHTPSGSRTSPPLDLSSLGTNPDLRAAWQADEPEGTGVKVFTAVTGETAHIGEAVGTGDGIEDAFYLKYYPAERHNDLIVYVDGVQTTEFTRPDTKDPRKIVFNAGHEPGDGLAVTADYTGVDTPAEAQGEAQTLYLGGATGGTFTLGDGTTDTDPIAYDATTETIQTALEAIYGEGNVTAETDTDFTITFVPAVGDSGLTADFTSLTGATDPALTLNTAYDAGDWEEQAKEITITNLPEGDFTGKWLWIKQVLETSDPAVTPLLENFRLYSVTEGGADYLVDLSNNPLLQDNYETALGTIYGAVKGVSFYPFTSQWQGDPAVQAGDIITQVDRDGKPYKTLVTHSTYKYRGASTLQGKGLPVKAKGYKGSTNRKFAEIIRKIDEVVGDKLTTLEQAQLHATEMIANMLGGHAIFTDDAIYIADSEDLDEAVKVWKWGIGGFGYSSTGKDGPYTTAITADGTIVAMLVAAGIVTANMIQTGVLQSQDGSSWFNLDNGTFNLKNMLKWVDNLLVLREPEDKARLAVGTDVFAMQAYDEEKEEWKNKIYFDPVQGVYIFDGQLSATMIAALEAQFDITVSNVMITNVLAAETGYIAQLTVDQLDTSTKVQKYLASDTSDVNYIKIYSQRIEFIEATTTGSQTEQATDRHGNPLYWKDDDYNIVTLEETDFPVKVYVYTEGVKLSITFENVGGVYTPKITMGLGDGVKPMSAKAEIFKGQTGLELNYYRSNTEELRQIIIDDAGIRQTGNTGVTGLRNITISAEAPTLSEMEVGDVWLQYSN